MKMTLGNTDEEIVNANNSNVTENENNATWF